MILQMKSWLFIWIACLVWLANADEYNLSKNQSDLIIEGRYLTDQSNQGKQFWICVDYESSVVVPERFGNRYPITGCGGTPKQRENLFWYAVHGIYEEDDKLSIRFKSSFQLWPNGDNEGHVSPSGSFLWSWNALTGSNDRFKLIQSHGITNYDTKRPDVDTLLLVGYGSVHVRGVKDGSDVHIRVKDEDETGITLEKVYEAKYNKEAGSTEKPEEVTEEPVSEPPFYRDIDFPSLQSEDKQEEVTTKVGLTNPNEPRLIDQEPFEIVHTNDGSTTTTDEPHLLVRIPELGEDGTQARPTANIPFIEPVYDQSSEEARKSQQSKFNNFENEVSEEDPTSTTQLLTTTQATIDDKFQNAIDEVNSLENNQETLANLLIQDPDFRNEYNYQLIYTIAISTALAFLCFFICIVLFRCYKWGSSSSKVNSYSPQTQQKHVVYTISGIDTLPVKVNTQ